MSPKEMIKYELQVKNLAKSFCHGQKQALKDINLEAHEGECIGILGDNGCGKSTLLSVLAGILKPDSGTVLWNGQKYSCKQQPRKHADIIGYVPQECPLIEELTAKDNLKLWYCDSPLSMEQELSEGFLGMLGIPDFLNVSVKHMSGGMKKRLSIGCAMAYNPHVLLLDEPGASLDLICKERIEVYLKEYKRQRNIILLATHEEREINLCDRIYILKNGVLLPFAYDGNIHTLISRFS